MTDEELADLRKRTDRLVRCLADDEPGLFSWHHAINAAWWGVVEWGDPEVVFKTLVELERVRPLIQRPETLAHSAAHIQAIQLLQEYSGKLWRDGQHERSVAIGDVIEGLAEESDV